MNINNFSQTRSILFRAQPCCPALKPNGPLSSGTCLPQKHKQRGKCSPLAAGSPRKPDRKQEALQPQTPCRRCRHKIRKTLSHDRKGLGGPSWSGKPPARNPWTFRPAFRLEKSIFALKHYGPNNNHNPDAQRQHNGPLRAYPVGHETKNHGTGNGSRLHQQEKHNQFRCGEMKCVLSIDRRKCNNGEDGVIIEK